MIGKKKGIRIREKRIRQNGKGSAWLDRVRWISNGTDLGFDKDFVWGFFSGVARGGEARATGRI